MKKKHRDIVVDGVQYGWTVESYYRLKIWKNKKVIAEYCIAEHHDAVTPKFVAALIKDPVDALKWINAEPCPFCGKTVEGLPVDNENNKEYFMVVHTEDCYYYKINDKFSVILKDNIEFWNNRS